MPFTISDKMLDIKASAIRESLKLSSDPNVIPFSAGNPSSETFPEAKIEEITADILQSNPLSVLQYSVSEGLPALRETLKTWLAKDYSIPFKESDLLITTGAQQGIDLVSKALVNEGDSVLVEEPSFLGALNTFRANGAKLVPVKLCPDGVDLESLENALKTASNPRFFYCIPTFQNPSGYTTSLEKRRAIYSLCKQYGVPVLEDNPYGDLRTGGQPLPTIRSMDEDEDNVVYLGSFSKILAPALRVGYVVAHNSLFEKLVIGKQATDVHTPTLNQVICNEFLTRWPVDDHIRDLQATYRAKCDQMCEAIDKYAGEYFEYVKPQGGLFLWCTLPDYIDMPDFCKKAISAGVAVVPGNAFNCDGSKPCQSFRVNYSTPSAQQIDRGVKILGEIAASYPRN